MSDRDGTLNTNPDHPLASALRALPDAAPQPDLWPDLARALQERHTAVPSAAKRAKTPGEGKPPTAARIIRFVPVALAAGVALAVLLPRSLLRQTTHETAPAMAGTTAAATPNAGAGSVAARADELATLHRRSQTLERWIAAVAARAGAVLYLAFAATTVGWGLWGALMARYPASTVAPFALLVPVFGLSFGALLLGEPVTVRDIVAAGLILGGVLLTLRAPRVAISPLVAGSSSPEACIPESAAREWRPTRRLETQRARP